MIGKGGEEEKEGGRVRSLVILDAFLRPRGLTHIYCEHRQEERRLMRHSFHAKNASSHLQPPCLASVCACS